MITLLAFVVTIALLVVFHELGHYWIARRCGVKVLRFSVGFGKVIYCKRAADGTEWVISAIPLGGYVKMLDEREGEVAPEDLRLAFNRKPVWQRMAIVAAGPVANLLLAIVLYWIMFLYGVPGLKPVLGAPPSGSPAAVAGMQPGEILQSVDGVAVPSWQDLSWALLERSLSGTEVRVDGLTADGQKLAHILELKSLKPGDIDANFLDKLGLKLLLPVEPAIIGKVAPGSPAQLAGLQSGDHVLRAEGVELKSWQDLVEVARTHPGIPVNLEIRRGERMVMLAIVPQAVQDKGRTIGRMGMYARADKAAWASMLTEVSYAPFEALRHAVRKTGETSVISLQMLGKMVLGEVSVKNLSGPITIADYAGQSAAMGVAAYLGFLALISVSLGVLNLLPIPLLDGGHLLYYAAELIKGGPLPEQAWELGQKIGIALLGTLMVFAIYNDITRLISE